MSEAWEIQRFKQSFNKALVTNISNSFKKTTRDTIKTRYRYYKTLRSFTSSRTTMDTDHFFEIDESYAYIGKAWLELVGSNLVAYDIGNGGAYNAIKRIRVEQGGRVPFSYTGDDLWKMTHLVNKNAPSMTEIHSLADPSSDPNATPLLVPILIPGSNLRYSLDHDTREPVFPIGALNSNLRITVTLQSGSYVSKTNDYGITSLKLKVFTFNLDNDDINNKRPTRSGIYYSWFFMRPISRVFTETLTDATAKSITLDTIIEEGMLNSIVVDVLDKTTHYADKEYQKTQSIDVIKLTGRGSDGILYQHDNAQSGRLQCLESWKLTNLYSGSASGFGYFYPIPLTCRPDISIENPGTIGLDLNGINPNLEITCTTLTNSGTDHDIRILALYKCLFSVKNNKNIDYTQYIQ